MSDPFSDPDARPWTSSGDPIVPSQPSSGFGAPDAPPPQPPPAFGQPPGADGWSQPPSAPPPPPWGAPAGDQAQWGQAPQAGPPGGQPWGQPGAQPWGQPGAQQWGQAPYGQPPQRSSSGRVILIVVAVLVVLLAVPIVAAVILFNVGSTTVGEVIEQGFDSAAGVPDGPRLLETSGSVGQGGSQAFPFTVPDRTRVQIDVIGHGGFDPVAVLRDPGGRELTEDDDGGEDRDSRITTELSSGTYTVDVRGFASAGGEFRVIVTDR
ncbi:MAG TPA: pre-peptidase C-terminal domain-containing protein [Euzebya sp.]|nr:pre-peptidase C-terminal domain-containing protein [Euzebya sp.]